MTGLTPHSPPQSVLHSDDHSWVWFSSAETNEGTAQPQMRMQAERKMLRIFLMFIFIILSVC
jgi:hypothetical protein